MTHRRALDLRVLLHRQRRQRPPARPARCTRLTTTASTGCLMKMSVNERIGTPRRCRFASAARRARRRVASATATSTRLAQLERARGGDLLAGLEARRGSATSSPSIGPLSTGRACARGLPSLSGGDDEHVVAARALAQRAHGNGDGRARRARPGRGRAPRRRAPGALRRLRSARGPWRCASSGSTRASTATIVAGDRRGVARRRRPRPCRPARSAGGDLLRDREVDVHRVVDALQRGELRAFVQVLAGVHVGHADARAERRADRLARDDRPWCARSAPARRRARRARGRLPSADAAPVCSRAASRVEHASRRARPAPPAPSSSASSTETSSATSTVPASTICPGARRDLADRAGDLVAQRDRAQREDGADRRRRAAVLALAGDGDGDRLHRLGLVARRPRRPRAATPASTRRGP